MVIVVCVLAVIVVLKSLNSFIFRATWPCICGAKINHLNNQSVEVVGERKGGER